MTPQFKRRGHPRFHHNSPHSPRNACLEPDAVFPNYKDLPTVPLSSLADGEEAIVVTIQSGRRAVTRLCHLGLTPGTRVKRVRGAPFHGPIQLRVRDTTLAIGRGLARHVMVTPPPD